MQSNELRVTKSKDEPHNPIDCQICQYDVEVIGKDARKFHVRISATAEAMAQHSVEARVERYFQQHPLPLEGATIEISDQYFDPSFFQ